LIDFHCLPVHEIAFLDKVLHFSIAVMRFAVVHALKEIAVTLDVCEFALVIRFADQVLVCEVQLTEANSLHVLRRELQLSLVGILEIDVGEPRNIVLLDFDVGYSEDDPLLALHQVPVEIEEHEEVANEYAVGDDLGATNPPLALILLVNLQTRYFGFPVDLATFRLHDDVGIAGIRQVLLIGVLQAQLIEL
jgi:hypothetical protein